MAFLPRPDLINRRVKSIEPVTTRSGTFTCGHEFKIIAHGPRGYDLEDSDGNKVLETGLIWHKFQVLEEPDLELLQKLHLDT